MPTLTDIFGGQMPTREGEMTLEMHGMSPIPLENRYGGLHRIFTVWFTPNLVPAAFFVGVLAYSLGLGFALGTAAIVLGTVLGALLVSIMCTWGPSTGVGQLPLARLQFGSTIILPGLLMWFTTIAWDALYAIFGAEAIHLLIHVPFWIGLVVLLAMQGVLGLFGYEVMHTFERWGSIVLGLMFVAITVKVFQVGNVHVASTVHGNYEVGTFILMVTIAGSFVLSWAAYASDYSRYMKPTSSRTAIFWLTLSGTVLSSAWLEILGLAAASAVLRHGDTSGAIRQLLGGGILGALALVAIWIGTVAANAMNDYSGSLALQAAGFRVRRPFIAVAATVVVFFLTIWLNTGDLATKFENVLLFVSYWVPPFAAVQLVDWWRKRGHMNVKDVMCSALKPGWDALIGLLVGFGAAVPFMDTSLYEGPASSYWLYGGDIAFVVGFVVGFVVYGGIRWASTGSLHDRPAPEHTAGPITVGSSEVGAALESGGSAGAG
jgi:NCS1 family nucleobase:cation symporter-1